VCVSHVQAAGRSSGSQLLLQRVAMMHGVVGPLPTNAGIQRLLVRSPGYDVQQLLAGSAATMDALVSGAWLLLKLRCAWTWAHSACCMLARDHDHANACPCVARWWCVQALPTAQAGCSTVWSPPQPRAQTGRHSARRCSRQSGWVTRSGVLVTGGAGVLRTLLLPLHTYRCGAHAPRRPLTTAAHTHTHTSS
jgi:hypothetical protein